MHKKGKRSHEKQMNTWKTQKLQLQQKPLLRLPNQQTPRIKKLLFQNQKKQKNQQKTKSRKRMKQPIHFPYQKKQKHKKHKMNFKKTFQTKQQQNQRQKFSKKK